jgi:hypothetical protein
VEEETTEEKRSTRDPFGWNYHLFRDLRREFSKISFGKQTIVYFELQANYKCLQRVYINGEGSTLQSTNIAELESLLEENSGGESGADSASADSK